MMETFHTVYVAILIKGEIVEQTSCETAFGTRSGNRLRYFTDKFLSVSRIIRLDNAMKDACRRSSQLATMRFAKQRAN